MLELLSTNNASFGRKRASSGLCLCLCVLLPSFLAESSVVLLVVKELLDQACVHSLHREHFVVLLCEGHSLLAAAGGGRGSHCWCWSWSTVCCHLAHCDAVVGLAVLGCKVRLVGFVRRSLRDHPHPLKLFRKERKDSAMSLVMTICASLGFFLK